MKGALIWRALQTGSKGLGMYSTVFILSYFYSPESFGKYSLFISVLAIIRVLGDFGLSRALVRFIPSALAEGKFVPMARTALFIQVGILLVLFSVFFSGKSLLIKWLFEESTLFYLVAPYAIAYLLLTYIESLFWGIENYKWLGITSVVANVGSMLLKLLLAWQSASIHSILVVDIACFFLNGGALWIALWRIGYSIRPVLPWLEADRQALRERFRPLFEYSATIGTSSVLFFLYTKIDVLILKLFDTFSEVGFLNLAVQIYEMPLFVAGVVTSVVLPKIARAHDQDNGQALLNAYRKGMRLVVVIMLASALSLATWIPWCIKEYFPAYASVRALLLMLAPFIIIKGVGQYCSGGFLTGTGRARFLLYANLFGGLANVIGDFWAAPRYGAAGVVWVTIVVHSLVLISVIVYTYRMLAKLKRERG